MAYIENDGIKIHFETEGDGYPLVLLHGFSSSAEVWRLLGYSDTFKKHYQVIRIDHRGHGLSDKPHETHAYTLQKRLKDLIKVLDHLNITHAHFFGYSMGGWSAMALAAFYPERVNTLVVGGAHPFEESADAFKHVDGLDPHAFLSALSEFVGESIEPQLQPLILKNDLQALVAAARHRDTLEPYFNNFPTEILFIVGAQDQRRSKVTLAHQKLPDSKVIEVPDANHFSTLFKSEIILPVVLDFLAKKTPDQYFV